MLVIAIATAVQPSEPVTLAVRNCRAECRDARDAIELAAAVGADRAPAGYYRLPVRAVGTDGAGFFINSEQDYRDQRNVTLAFRPDQAELLVRMMNGRSVEQALVGGDLVVWGRPERVRIEFRDDRGPTGLYYYQTHIRIADVRTQLFRPK